MEVTLINHWGDDLNVVNNARVSFSKASSWEYQCHLCGSVSEDCKCQPRVFSPGLKKEDKNLINYLARGMTSKDFETFITDTLDEAYKFIESGDEYNKERFIESLWEWRKTPEHWTPFGNGNGALFHVKVPIFLARQLDKHQIGFVKSEISRRYVDSRPEIYRPNYWRVKAPNVKQGSGTGEAKFESWWANDFEIFNPDVLADLCVNYYEHLIEIGVCAEQARMVLPQSMYTEYRWSGNLYGWANLFNQRSDPHAQKEAQDFAYMIGKEMEKHFPVSWKALTGNC